MAIKLDVLSCSKGDIKIDTNDDKPEERALLATEIKRLLKKGFFISLVKGKESTRILGYNAATNEWVLEEGRGQKKSPAAETTATVVAPIAGG